MVPYLGVAVGWLPVLLSIETAGVPQAVALVALASGLQIVEMTWWRRRVDRLTLHLGPAIPLIAAVLGYSVYGIGRAIYRAAITVFGVALLDELSTDTAPIPTPLDRPDQSLLR
jgi:predicted PurR-regulated permease PerM